MSKIKIEDIQVILATENWQLESTEYKNLDGELIFKCPEGHLVYSSWKKMRNRRDCPVCKKNEITQFHGQVVEKKKGVVRCLALDQATRDTGYAVFDNGKLIKYGIFSAPDLEETARIDAIKKWILSVVQTLEPDYVAIEGIQHQDKSQGEPISVTVFQSLARLQGVLLQTFFELEIPCEVVPTNTWRHFCGVKGRTRVDKKRSMQLLIKEWYDVSISNDEADAIGIGRYLTHNLPRKNIMTNWEI